jgi:hypothetical protein
MGSAPDFVILAKADLGFARLLRSDGSNFLGDSAGWSPRVIGDHRLGFRGDFCFASRVRLRRWVLGVVFRMRCAQRDSTSPVWADHFCSLFQKTGRGYIKGKGLKRSLQSAEPFHVLMSDSIRGNLLSIFLFGCILKRD